MVRLVGARQVLEIGALGGYSSIWMARALPDDGKLISIEASEHHAKVARENLKTAGLLDRVSIREGIGIEELAKLAQEGVGPFDFVFIDADKANNPHYVSAVLGMTRKGGIIITDNVIRSGRIMDENSGDPDIVGTRELFDLLASEGRSTRLDSTVLQTVGAKGWDGFAISMVL